MNDQTAPARPGIASRRGFLIGGGAVVALAAGGGVALGLAATSDRSEQPAVAPEPHLSPELTAAADSERALLAQYDAALANARGHHARVLRAIRANHAAHLTALRAALADDAYPLPTPTRSSSRPTSPAPTTPASPDRAALRGSETRAARAAADRALRLGGRDAALLASIAASEAAHAELLA
jgi:hypothetical protein